MLSMNYVNNCYTYYYHILILKQQLHINNVQKKREEQESPHGQTGMIVYVCCSSWDNPGTALIALKNSASGANCLCSHAP